VAILRLQDGSNCGGRRIFKCQGTRGVRLHRRAQSKGGAQGIFGKYGTWNCGVYQFASGEVATRHAGRYWANGVGHCVPYGLIAQPHALVDVGLRRVLRSDGLKILVQHRYPGRSRSQRVVSFQYQRISFMEYEKLSRLFAAESLLRAIGQVLSRASIAVSSTLTYQHASPVTYRAMPPHQRTHRWGTTHANWRSSLTYS
jgi:hypothetical protein